MFCKTLAVDGAAQRHSIKGLRCSKLFLPLHALLSTIQICSSRLFRNFLGLAPWRIFRTPRKQRRTPSLLNRLLMKWERSTNYSAMKMTRTQGRVTKRELQLYEDAHARLVLVLR